FLDMDAETKGKIIAITAALGASKEGMAGALSVSVNTIIGDTKVFVSGKKTLGQDIEGAVTMDAIDESYIFSLAGSLAASDKASFGIALSYNEIDKIVTAYLLDTKLDAASLAMKSSTDATIHNITAGGAVAKTLAAGGSVSVNNIGSDTETYIKNSEIETVNSISLDATDNLKIGAISGTVAGAGKAAIGVAIATNNIGTSGDPNKTRSYIENSKVVSTAGGLSLSSVSNSVIKNITGAGTIAGDGGLSGAASINNVYSLIEAFIKDCNAAERYVRVLGDLIMKAEDHSTVSIISVTLAVSGKVSAGAAVGTVNIGTVASPHVITANIDNSNVETTGGKAELTAKADAVIFNFTAGIAVGGNAGAQGSVSVNNVRTNTGAEIRNNSIVNTKNGVTLKAHASNRDSIPASAVSAGDQGGSIGSLDMESDDDSEDDRRITTIQSLAGAVAGGGSGSIGAAVATNDVRMNVNAAIASSIVTSSDGQIHIEAISEASIETLSAAIVITNYVAIAAGVSLNKIENDTNAYILNSTVTANYVENDPLKVSGVVLTAKDTSSIIAVAGQVNVAVNGGGIGAAAAFNEIANEVRAYVENSTVTSKSSLSLDADSDSEIKATAAGGGFGLYVSLTGSVAKNTIANSVFTSIYNSTVSADKGVYLDSVNSSKISSLAGSLSTSAFAAIGGSLAINNIGCKSTEADDGYVEDDQTNDKGTKVTLSDIATVGTKSWIENSRIISGTVVKLSASTDSMIKSISAAGGGALVAVNGAISMNNIYMDTESYIKGCIDTLDPAVKLVSSAGNISLEAYDNSAASSIAGNVSVGAVGAGAAVSTVNIGDGTHVNRTRAYIDSSRVTSTNGSISLKAMTNSFIFNIAAGASVGGIGLQGSVAVNNVTTKTSAEILNGSVVTAKNSIVLEALIEKRETIPASMLQADGGDELSSSFDGNPDDNDGTLDENETTHTLKTIQSLAGAVAGGGTGGIGAGVATNNVKNSVVASISASDVTSDSGDVIIVARSSASIETVSAALAGGSYSAALAVSLNWIENSVLAFISDSDVTSKNTSAYAEGSPVPGIGINASDTSVIRSVAGQVSIAGTAGIGAGAAYNEIGNTVKAYADSASKLVSSGSILIIAKSDSTIETIAAGGSGGSVALAGSAAINLIGNRTESYVDHSTAEAAGNVYILADSLNKINAYGGALTGGAIGIGAVAVVNNVENTTLAYSSYSDIKAKGTKEELDVKSWDYLGVESLVKAKGLFIVADCDDKVTVYSGSLSIGALALSGQLSVTLVSDTTKAYIVASTINSMSDPGMWVKVKAHQGTEVDVKAGGLTVGAVAVGAAVDHTSIKNTTYAYIDKDNVTKSVVYGQDVEVTTDTLEDVGVIVAGVSISGSIYSVSVSGSVSVALVDCDNRAYINDSDVAVIDKLSILANDIAKVSSTSYILAASTFAGAGGTVSVNTIRSSTLAETKGGNLKAYGAMEIKAVSSDKIETVLGTMAVGGAAGLAGAVSVNTIESTTEANVVKGSAAAWINKGYPGSSQQTVKVSATNTSTIDGTGGSLAGGIGAGIGATVDVAAIRNRVVASVGLETEIYASGDITIEALSRKNIYSKVSSKAGGLLGVSGAVSVISIGEAMDKTAGDEFAITDDNDGSLMTQVSGDTQIGSMGLGSDGTSSRAGSMLSTMDEPDIASLVGTTANTEGKVTAAFLEAAASSAGRVIVKAGGKLTVKADSIVHIDASMDNLALGIAGVGAVVAVVRTNEKTNAFIGDYADILAGSLLIMAESAESAQATGKAATGGFLVGITANIADVSIKPAVKAYVGSNAYVFSKGDVEIAAIVTPKVSAVVQGTTASAGVSVGVSSSTAKAEPDVSAWIGDYSKVYSGATLLNGNPNIKFMSSVILSGAPTLTFKNNYVETIGTMTFAQDAVNGDTITRASGSWITDGYKAEDGIVVVRGTQTTQYVIHSLTAETLTLVEKGAVAAGAAENVKVSSDRADTITRASGSWFIDGFEAGQAITVAGTALNNGAYEIKKVTETELILMQNYELKNEVKSGVTVTADTKDRIRRGSGDWYSDGFRAGQEIRVSGTASNDGTYIVESVSTDGKFLVLESMDRLTVEITTAAAFVIVDQEAIKPQLTVSAILLIPDNGIGMTANADAKASSGALLIGVSSTNALASTTSLVTAYTGTGVRLDAAGIAEINAYAFTSQKAVGTSKTGGIVAVGGNTAKAESTSTISAYTGTGLRIAADELRITAFGDEKNLSDSTAGTGGLVAGSAAKAETSSTSTTRAEIGTSADRISLIGLLIYADHTSRFDGKVDSTSASLLGKSGAEAIHSVNAGVSIKIGDVTIPAYNIVATAINSSSKDYIGGDYNAWSGSGGGLVDVPATRSLSTIIHTTGIEVADGANLEVIGDKYYPGSLALSALNSVYARDRVKLVSGGAIALAKASSKVETNALTAYVTIGDADIKSVGDIDLSARTIANIITDTFVHTSGGAGAAQGDSKSFVKAVNTITLSTGADLFSEGEVNLLAGANSNGDVNTYNLKSSTNLENYTALPVNSNPDAVAGF
ncbi:MAG: hypothetical protein K0M69_04360, partial [Youngiibacter sp.]|nr:hypothetical protein [Youngiibacter sp.]